MEEKFNGWENRETWAVALWIDNDQVLSEIAQDYARTELEGHDEGEVINPYYLGETLKSWIEDDLLTLENIKENHSLWLMLTDIGSLYRVNWREIAEHYLDASRLEVGAILRELIDQEKETQK